jgi:hypothetical protein
MGWRNPEIDLNNPLPAPSKYALIVHAPVVKIAKANLRFIIFPVFSYSAEDFHRITSIRTGAPLGYL